MGWKEDYGHGSHCIKVSGLVPVDSIRGKVHSGRAEIGTGFLHGNVQGLKKAENLCNASANRSKAVFYLNRF